ncbi:hypothetical protein CORC01_01370 [Colletotrichum orchidophilum]|uniref:Heterokaryon incompatibility domain-containing protein n=1 Tax=Colletotrichum orchidophilum TaxID=1209926 RepID=A0A1G4BPS4_9PEZI|nr:uncharacterized protein CORC01_01370 [Colletotrichum orchidophilum]OHF03317.1 hypothetical protein CORC01_01370 [Colletotrichum orchidophilum]
MQDDTGHIMSSIGPEDLENVQGLWRFQLHRVKARTWAYRDIKFLVYDDTVDKEEVDSEAGQSSKDTVESDDAPIAASSETPLAQADGDADNFECRICSKLSTFPHDKRTRNFRLFNPTDEFPHLITKHPKFFNVCVQLRRSIVRMYCWPEQVSDEDGKPIVSHHRVAVDFANSVGLRIIWIDQECLSQPKEDGSEEDEAYPRLDRSTEELRFTSFRPRLFEYPLDFLYMVQPDKWHTRAWVIQEAVSVGDGLVLVFRRGPCIVYTSKFRANQKTGSIPRHPLDPEKRTLQSEIICIPVDRLQALVQTGKSLLEQRIQLIRQALVRTSTDDTIPVLSAAESLHPKIIVRQHAAGIHAYGGKVYGGRQKVNAVSALTLLKGGTA